VVVFFFYIGRIVDHHCLNFLFIILTEPLTMSLVPF
jgi:hypothetical protein